MCVYIHIYRPSRVIMLHYYVNITLRLIIIIPLLSLLLLLLLIVTITIIINRNSYVDFTIMVILYYMMLGYNMLYRILSYRIVS